MAWLQERGAVDCLALVHICWKVQPKTLMAEVGMGMHRVELEVVPLVAGESSRRAAEAAEERMHSLRTTLDAEFHVVHPSAET